MGGRSCSARQETNIRLHFSVQEKEVTKDRTFFQRLAASLSNRVRLFVFQHVSEENEGTHDVLLRRIAVCVPTFHRTGTSAESEKGATCQT